MTNRSYVAVTTAQHPLTGESLPRTKLVTEETTLRELFEWYRGGNEWNIVDLRITENTK